MGKGRKQKEIKARALPSRGSVQNAILERSLTCDPRGEESDCKARGYAASATSGDRRRGLLFAALCLEDPLERHARGARCERELIVERVLHAVVAE